MGKGSIRSGWAKDMPSVNPTSKRKCMTYLRMDVRRAVVLSGVAVRGAGSLPSKHSADLIDSGGLQHPRSAAGAGRAPYSDNVGTV